MVAPAISDLCLLFLPFFFVSINASYQTEGAECLALDQDDLALDQAKPEEQRAAGSQASTRPNQTAVARSGCHRLDRVNGRRAMGQRRGSGDERRAAKAGQSAAKSGRQLAESGWKAAKSRMQRSGAANFAQKQQRLIPI
jgi:hypothetical protein